MQSRANNLTEVHGGNSHANQTDRWELGLDLTDFKRGLQSPCIADFLHKNAGARRTARRAQVTAAVLYFLLAFLPVEIASNREKPNKLQSHIYIVSLSISDSISFVNERL